MKILLLGSKGMLGQALRDVFAENHEVTCWDKAAVDITDEQAARKKIIPHSPDIIINAAAYTDVDGAEKERKDAFAVNEQGVKNLAQIAKDMESTLVHYSTDYVFPGDKKEGYSEIDPPGPAINTYGESKLAGERAFNPRHYLIRTAWLYGAGGKNFVNTMLGLAQNHDTIKVVNDQHGSPTYTLDLAKATKNLIEQKMENGIYHLTNDGVATWEEFAREIFKITDTPINIEPVTSDQFPRPAKRPAWSILINNKAPKLPPWQEALREYLTSHLTT